MMTPKRRRWVLRRLWYLTQQVKTCSGGNLCHGCEWIGGNTILFTKESLLLEVCRIKIVCYSCKHLVQFASSLAWTHTKTKDINKGEACTPGLIISICYLSKMQLEVNANWTPGIPTGIMITQCHTKKNSANKVTLTRYSLDIFKCGEQTPQIHL